MFFTVIRVVWVSGGSRQKPQNGQFKTFKPIFSIKTSKCSGSCHNINNPYAKISVPDVIKHLNVKACNLMSRTNETRFIEWHETCKCKC